MAFYNQNYELGINSISRSKENSTTQLKHGSIRPSPIVQPRILQNMMRFQNNNQIVPQPKNCSKIVQNQATEKQDSSSGGSVESTLQKGGGSGRGSGSSSGYDSFDVVPKSNNGSPPAFRPPYYNLHAVHNVNSLHNNSNINQVFQTPPTLQSCTSITSTIPPPNFTSTPLNGSLEDPTYEVDNSFFPPPPPPRRLVPHPNFQQNNVQFQQNNIQFQNNVQNYQNCANLNHFQQNNQSFSSTSTATITPGTTLTNSPWLQMYQKEVPQQNNSNIASDPYTFQPPQKQLQQNTNNSSKLSKLKNLFKKDNNNTKVEKIDMFDIVANRNYLKTVENEQHNTSFCFYLFIDHFTQIVGY